MKALNLIFILTQLPLLPVQFVQGASNPNVNSSTFCYDQVSCGQTNWPPVCNTGTSQSPIDISLTLFLPVWAPPVTFDLNLNYSREIIHTLYGQNNGHSAQFDVNPDLAALTSSLQIGGGGLQSKYTFAQLHFHWSQTDDHGSEHTINGNSYPMEMHIVHYKSTYASLAAAVNQTDPEAVAVMAVFFKVSTFQNTAIQPFVNALSQLEDPGQLKEFDVSLRLASLYPKKLEFARYLGSLTTPTCDEKVVWTVFLRPVSISRDQMTAFRQLTNEEDLSSFNYRNTQPLNGRQIFHPIATNLDFTYNKIIP